MESMRKKLIGYVSGRDFPLLIDKDIRSLDVINIAFGAVENDRVIYKAPDGFEKELQRVRSVNPQCKLVLSVGGWTAGGFSEAAATEEGRALFAQTSAALLERYALDGLDIDWEYPCIDTAGIAASPDDKITFTKLLKSCRTALDAMPGMRKMLTIAAGAGDYFIEYTQMAEVQKYLDYVQLMTYDMRGGYRHETGHHTNLFTDAQDPSPLSMESSVHSFEAAGVPPEKLVVGAAFYSRIWKGVPNVNNGLHQEAETIGDYGPGFDTLVESYINKNGYTRFFDEAVQAPWLFNGNTFLSYDDEASCRAKADFLKKEGLAGIMFWEYGLDKTYTLTSVLREALDAR